MLSLTEPLSRRTLAHWSSCFEIKSLHDKQHNSTPIQGSALGCVHINTSTSPALYGYPVYEFRQTRVCVYFSSGRSHTYEYGLPVNFTRMSIFCAGHVFIQLVESKLPGTRK